MPFAVPQGFIHKLFEWAFGQQIRRNRVVIALRDPVWGKKIAEDQSLRFQ